jgi:hypothetical protein
MFSTFCTDMFLKIEDFESKKQNNPFTGPEGSGRLRHPDFKTVGTCRW